MNVIISNEKQSVLANLNIEVIKSINGVFTAEEIVDMFSNFFFGRMILDLTALNNYKDIKNLQKISMVLDVEKIIILLPEDPECLAPRFLSRIISMGIYNFTTNLEGVNYLLDNPNSYRDVAHIHQIEDNTQVVQQTVVNNNGEVSTQPVNVVTTTVVSNGPIVIGIKNITDHAGATSLTYMMKNELKNTLGKNTLAIEVDKHDFLYFDDKELLSLTAEKLPTELLKQRDKAVILVDLNDTGSEELCNDIIYLLEPSTIKLNKLLRRDRKVFDRLMGKKIILNKTLLNDKDVSEFEYEARTKIFYTLPSIDERDLGNDKIKEVLIRLGLV